MVRCFLGEVTSEESKGEKRCEVLGVRFCEECLPSLVVTMVATSFMDAGRRQETSGWETEDFISCCTLSKQCVMCPWVCLAAPTPYGIDWQGRKGPERLCSGFVSHPWDPDFSIGPKACLVFPWRKTLSDYTALCCGGKHCPSLPKLCSLYRHPWRESLQQKGPSCLCLQTVPRCVRPIKNCFPTPGRFRDPQAVQIED